MIGLSAATRVAMPLRVLLVTDVSAIGGAERRLIAFASRLDRTRFDVAFCTLSGEGPLHAELRSRGFATYALNAGGVVGYLRAIARLARLVRAWRPHVLHGQIRYASFVAGLVGRLIPVPVVLATRTYTERFGRHAMLDRLTSRLVDLTVAVSAASGQRAEAMTRRGRVHVIPNGIDLDEFVAPPPAVVAEEARRLGATGDRVFGCVGHLHPIKGHRYLVDAVGEIVRAVPRAKLLLVGGGALAAELAARAAAQGMADRVVITGTRTDVPVLMSLMEVFVLPSLSEGMSHALLEAMAFARPVVATAVGGNVEVVEDGISGLLVPPADAGALGRAVIRLLTDAALARKLGDAARTVVHTRYSAPRMVDDYSALWTSLAAERGALHR